MPHHVPMSLPVHVGGAQMTHCEQHDPAGASQSVPLWLGSFSSSPVRHDLASAKNKGALQAALRNSRPRIAFSVCT